MKRRGDTRLSWAALVLVGLLALVPNKQPRNVVEAIFGIDDILIMLAIQLLMSVISMALAPKPARQKPPSVTDWQNPTADAGRPIPVIFGTITITGINVLWFGEKQIKTVSVSA
jgi:hypothetical protein